MSWDPIGTLAEHHIAHAAMGVTGGASVVGADPTASPGVGLSAINGVATTFMRSDAAPALDVGIAPTWTAAHAWTQASSATPTITITKPAAASSGLPHLRLAYDASNYADLTEWNNELSLSGAGTYYETNLYPFYFQGHASGGAWVTISAGPWSGFTVSDNTDIKKSLMLTRSGTEQLRFYHAVSPNAATFTGQYIDGRQGTTNVLGSGSTYDPGGINPRPDVRVAFGTFNSGTPLAPDIYAVVCGPDSEYDTGGEGLYDVLGGTPYKVLNTGGSTAGITWGGAHTFNSGITVNGDLNLGTDGDIKSNRSDSGASSYMVRIQENASYPFTAANDRYYLLIEDSAGTDVFYLTTAGNVYLAGGGLVTGGAPLSYLDSYGNFFSKAWTITDGSTKYGMGLNSTVTAITTAGSSVYGSQFIVQGGSSTVNMNTMGAASFEAYATPNGTTLSMLRGARFTTNLTAASASTYTTTAVEGLNISHAHSGTNQVTTFVRNIKIDNASALGAGSSIGYLYGIEIAEMTRGTSGNFGIVLAQSTAGYKALCFRDANAWINSGAASDLDLNAATSIDMNIGGTEQIGLTSSLMTFKDVFNIAVGTGTGTKIGTGVTQKLGFWDKTPVIQPKAANQAALTNSTGGTYDGTLAAIGDTTASDQSAALNNNFTDLHTLLNEIRTALVDTGLIKGAA